MDNVCRPVIFEKEAEFRKFFTDKPDIKLVDAFTRQLRELFVIDNRQYIGREKERVYASADFKKYCQQKAEDFVYVYYPWNGHIVKTVKEQDYFRLKTNRNQDLITVEEQKKLYNAKVAVFGMSVGSNIAFVLTQAGIGRNITIADFDDLDATNLNRILAGVHQIGLNKAIIASRRIYEDNPFAEVNVLEKGIDRDSLAKLLSAQQIEYIIEEVDDMKVKIDTRRLARQYKVPVIMITDNGDGVVLHVERYDLGYDKIFGQGDDYWEEKLKAPMSKELAGKIIMNDIVGGADKVDKKMLASVRRVLARELVSWSQLGSAAILGGVVATAALKRIILGESRSPFSRHYIVPPEI